MEDYEKSQTGSHKSEPLPGSNEALYGHPQPRKLREVREELEKLLPKCVVGAGEDNPPHFRACVYCGLIEWPNIDFHKPDCPVVALQRLLLLVEWY